MRAELSEPYFSRILAWIVLVSSAALSMYLVLWNNSCGWPIFFTILNIILFTPKYVTRIDTAKKYVIDQFWFCWIPIRSTKTVFDQLHHIKIDKERHTYRANQRARDRVADFSQYLGILVYDSGEIELYRDTEFQPFVEKMNRIATDLNIPVERVF